MILNRESFMFPDVHRVHRTVLTPWCMHFTGTYFKGNVNITKRKGRIPHIYLTQVT